MGLVQGKCPVCGEIIKVNDEKENGFCSKCGSKIDVLESIMMLDGQEVQQVTHTKSRKSVDPHQMVYEMFQMCGNEQEFLDLREKVMGMGCTDGEKAAILEELDAATKVRIKDLLEKEKKYKEVQESPASTIVGCIIMVLIGLVVGSFMGSVLVMAIGVVMGVLGVIGTISERSNKKQIAENKAAADLVALYRQKGYKV